jgi:hypothetical protein
MIKLSFVGKIQIQDTNGRASCCDMLLCKYMKSVDRQKCKGEENREGGDMNEKEAVRLSCMRQHTEAQHKVCISLACQADLALPRA